MKPEVSELADETGVEIFDPIEKCQVRLYVRTQVTPERRRDAGDRFSVPVDSVFALPTDELLITDTTIYARDANFDFIGAFDTRDEATFPNGRIFELTARPMKLYFWTPAGAQVERVGDGRVRFTAVATDEILVGARSIHETPAETIQVPEDPHAAVPAFEALAAALKTTSSEHSWPTLRGHPPAFERADSLSIPSSVTAPETGVTLRMPITWENLYAAAPAIYYLGADVEEGSPGVVADGVQRTWDDLQTGVHRLLEQAVYCDSVVRSVGVYTLEPESLSELPADVRSTIAPSALYGNDLAARLGRYLSIPYERIEPYLPEWLLSVTVDATVDQLEAIPYLVNDLPEIRPTETSVTSGPGTVEGYDPVAEFFRTSPAGETTDDGLRDTISMTEADAIEQAYLGDMIPIGANALDMEVLEERVGRDSPESSGLSIGVVCNEPEMDDETLVAESYRIPDYLSIDVEIHRDLSTSEARTAFETDVDLLHYIGHIDDSGIRCSDGYLDARSLDDAPRTFLLNACSSYEQGEALLDAGSVAGVATLVDVGNSTAQKFGETVAKALSAGFSVRSALRICDQHLPTRYRYLCLGDGSFQLVPAPSGIPYLVEFVDVEHNVATVDLHGWPGSFYGIGAMTSPDLAGDNQYLAFGHLDRVTADLQLIDDWLDSQLIPLVAGDTLYWSDELSKSRLREEIAQVVSGTHRR